MKSRVIIFCVLGFCSNIVVSLPFTEDLVRQRANDGQIAYNSNRRYDNAYIARPQYGNYYENRQYNQELPQPWQSNGYENNFHQFTTPDQVIASNRVPVNNFPNVPLQNQFIKPGPIDLINRRPVENNNIQGYRNYEQGWVAPSQYYPAKNDQQTIVGQYPSVVHAQPAPSSVQVTSIVTKPVPVIEKFNLVKPAFGSGLVEPPNLKPVSAPIVTASAHQLPPRQENNFSFISTPFEQTPEVRNSNQNYGNIPPKRYAEQHHLDRIQANQEVQKALSSVGKRKRYLVLHPNGTVEHVENLDTISQKYHNTVFVNANQVKDLNKFGAVTTSPIPKSTLSTNLKPENDDIGFLPNPVLQKNTAQVSTSTTEATPATPVTAPASTIPLTSSTKPQDDEIITLSPIEVPKDQLTDSPLPVDSQTTQSTVKHAISQLGDSLTTSTTNSANAIIIATTTTNPVTTNDSQYGNTITADVTTKILETQDYELPFTSKTPLNEEPKNPNVPLTEVENNDTYKTTTPRFEIVETTTIPSVVSTTAETKSQELNPSPVPSLSNSTAPSITEYSGIYVTTTTFATTVASITDDDSESSEEDDDDDDDDPVSTISPVLDGDLTTSTSYTQYDTVSTTVTPSLGDAPRTLSTFTADPSTSSTHSNDTSIADEIDLSKLKSTTKPVVWFRTTNTDFWDKLSSGNETYDVVYFMQIHPQPMIEKDSKAMIYPNGTVIEEITETKWESKEDPEPIVTKSVKVTNPT